MRANLQLLICDAEEIFVSRISGAVPSRDLARAWYQTLLENPRRAIYPELIDLRRFTGAIVESDWLPVRTLRRQLLDQMGYGPDFKNTWVLLTADDGHGRMLFEINRHRSGHTPIFHAVAPEQAWAIAAAGAPMPESVHQFLRVPTIALAAQDASVAINSNVIAFSSRRREA